jgi:hypothetical protein
MSTSLAPGVDAPVRHGRERASGLAVARRLSFLLAGLVAASSAAGFWKADLYEDSRAVAEMYRGYDLISLAIVTPALIAAVVLSSRSVRASLVWVAALVFLTYNYALYVFGARFNDVFLVHVAIFSLSIFALGLALANLDVARIARSFSNRTPVRAVAGMLLLLALALGGMWVVGSLRFALTGELPREASKLVLPTAMTHLGWVLDLGLLVPAYAATAILLWRRSVWGYVLAPSLLVAGTVQQLTYMVALPFQANAGIPGAVAFDPQEPLIALVYVIASVALLASVRSRSTES